ncbi:MAG: malonyl-CoA decarboxylase [Rhodospirillaceae bacterium]|nr:malonyl-CoA decarboxylase [Rhodospirillaceae bacterium]
MTETNSAGFWDRTLSSAWRVIAGVARTKSREYSPDLPDSELDVLRTQLNDCLIARGGEVTARAGAAALGHSYIGLNSEGRRRFLHLLASEINANRETVERAILDVQRADTDNARLRAERTLQEALQSPRITLYRQFTALPEGVKFLVDFRADLLRYKRDDPPLEVIEAELKSILTTWFDVGLLELRRIEWASPASLLEKLIAYEAVHQINDWDDLKNRLGSDRRCFSFFHPNMPNEPLIFVEVALVNGVSDNIQRLLDQEAPVIEAATADCAIFYSISNAQAGLKGISLGDFLIKRVVDLLAHDFTNLKTFATLSPIPGFSDWVYKTLEGGILPILLSAGERKRLQALCPCHSEIDALKGSLMLVDWYARKDVMETLAGPMLKLAARYLLYVKRTNGFVLNQVAHFHLSNGARIERLNWFADSSKKGLAESFGIMANYLYKLNEIETNHESYRSKKTIKSSATVRSLAKGGTRSLK